MKVIVVRHGESIGGKQKIHQAEDMPLSQVGLEQALKASASLKNSSAAYVLSSELLRANQTAEVIGEALNLEVKRTDIFNEWKRPSELVGRSYEDEEARKIKRVAREHYADPNWHYSDEENFAEIVQRAKQALELLSMDTVDKIVVTHARLLSVILWLLSTDTSLNPKDYLNRQQELHIGLCDIRFLFYENNGWHL